MTHDVHSTPFFWPPVWPSVPCIPSLCRVPISRVSLLPSLVCRVPISRVSLLHRSMPRTAGLASLTNSPNSCRRRRARGSRKKHPKSSAPKQRTQQHLAARGGGDGEGDGGEGGAETVSKRNRSAPMGTSGRTQQDLLHTNTHTHAHT
jgi:hypothetical protein